VKDALGPMICCVDATHLRILVIQYFRWLTDEEMGNVMDVETDNSAVEQKCMCNIL
jgi:hypothetical protein